MCANVLIEADKRGIDSHGIGSLSARFLVFCTASHAPATEILISQGLKPIYMDRIKSGILKPFAPIDIIKETETTALIDANMGIGLYVGPHCMDMAITKAKKHLGESIRPRTQP